MKGLFAGIAPVAFFVHSAFSGAPIETNSFARHDITFSSTPLDFAVGDWKSAESMVAAISTTKLEIFAIGSDSAPSENSLTYDAPSATGPIIIGDVDGNAGNDIVFGAGANVIVRLNTSSATGPAFDVSALLAVGASVTPRNLALADLDGDGKLDIVYATGAIYALRNQSTAGAISFAAPVTIYTNAASFQIADLDGDGRPDLDVTPSPLSVSSYLLNTSSPGAFSFNQSFAGSSIRILLDANGDDKPDHVAFTRMPFKPVREEPQTRLSISTNSSSPGTVSFSRPILVSIDVPEPDFPGKIGSTLPSFRPNVVAADFNQDGNADFAWAYQTNRLVILENLSPRYLTTWGQGVELSALRYPYHPTVADVNHDGRLDVIVGSGLSRLISIFENRIEPIPELVVIVDTPQSAVDVGASVSLSAAAYGADVTAIDFLEDGNLIATATTANGFRAQYQPTTPGTHTISARATAGANTGLVSSSAGLRVRDPNIGRIVGFGSGVLSQTTLLIYDSGRAFGVGSNARGQLADPFYDTPHAGFVEIVAPPNAGGWKSLGAGLGFTVGLTASGRVFTWGVNDVGQLGRQTAAVTNPVPGEVIFANAGIRKVGAGSNFAVAFDTNGEIFGWGANYYGQLGKGDTAQRSTPGRIKRPEGVARWIDMSVGQGHVLALGDTGQLFAWGWNYWGQAGQPRANFAVLAPTLINLPPGETVWTNINAGVVASYAQTASGQTYRWGNYFDQDGNEVSDHTPTLLEAPEGSGGFRMVGAGAPLNVALGNDGNAYVWGGGILAPTGLGIDTAITNPTRLPLPAGVSRWTDLAVAARRAAALADDGRIFVWGLDFTDALGTGTAGANVPTEPCLPLQPCASNYPPAVKIVHPARGDIFPANRFLRFEIAADDFDGVIEFVKIFAEDTFTLKQSEVARLRFGETTIQIPVPANSTFVSYIPVAYDNSGLISTGTAVRLSFPSQNSGALITLTNTAPTNALTGWREVLASFRNNSSFYYGSVTAVLSNLPPGTIIRNNTFPSGNDTERIINNFGVAPGETITFRIEYKLPVDVPGARILVSYSPGAAGATGNATGEVQPITMTILTNGLRVLEFDHSLGQEHVVQFTDTLTNWINAAGFFEQGEGKQLWLDGGPPATPKHPAQSPRRFYRILRKP